MALSKSLLVTIIIVTSSDFDNAIDRARQTSTSLHELGYRFGHIDGRHVPHALAADVPCAEILGATMTLLSE